MQPKSVACKTCGSTFIVTNPRSRQVFCSKKCRPPRKYNVPERSCETCGIVFKPKYTCQRYCGSDCKWSGFSKSRKVDKEASTCIFCGKEFVSRKRDKKYCTQECYFASKKKFVTKTCEACGENFVVAYRFRDQKVCDQKCMGLLYSKTRNCKSEKECLNCGKTFEVIPSKDIQKYCSYDCYLCSTKARQPDVTKICESCKEEFIVPFTKNNRRFCSKSCSRTGEFNPMYGKPGLLTGKQAWSHGLTAKTDVRLRALGKKISSVIADKIVSGSWSPPSTGFKGEHYAGIKNGGAINYLRSSFESTYARLLDSDSDVVSWEHEPFRIPYMFEGSVHNYVPDFLVTRICGTFLVEVKPKMLVDTNLNIAKQRAAHVWCEENRVTFLIITEDDLHKIGENCQQIQP